MHVNVRVALFAVFVMEKLSFDHARAAEREGRCLLDADRVYEARFRLKVLTPVKIADQR